MTAAEKVDVLLVEDEAHTRRMLNDALVQAPRVARVIEVGTVHAAMEALGAQRAQVLVTDLQLPDGSGLDVIRQARAADADMPILVITVLGTEQVVLDAIAHGADGYLLKTATRSEIATAMGDLLAGAAPISPSIARHVLKRFRHLDNRAPVGTDVPKLSGREREILGLVGKGMKSSEIADVLGITTHTVNSHIKSIYRKLEVASRTEAVYEATRMGILGAEY